MISFSTVPELSKQQPLGLKSEANVEVPKTTAAPMAVNDYFLWCDDDVDCNHGCVIRAG